jgi:glycosyltransferase involved in cell wall biosynthesis
MNQPFRVLQVIGQMDRGGAETMIMNLYRNIDRTKVQFDFIVHTEQKCAYDDEILALGGKIFHVPRFTGMNIFNYQKAWKSFFDEHKEYKIIHGHIGSSAAIYLKIAKENGLFTIAHSHNTKNEPNLKGKMYSAISYPTRYVADHFFGCSKSAGKARYGNKVVSSSNFNMLNNAINTEDFIYSNKIRDKKRLELGLDNKFVLGHVGRFNLQKNHTFLIDIFYKINKKMDNSILVLIGDGELRESVENKVRRLGLEGKVIFTGVRSDIPEIMQALDVFLFPSLFEGLPVTVIEAQATSLPCIISNTITEDVNITSNLVEFVPLEEKAEYWAEKVLNCYGKFERVNTYTEIVKEGYDIKDTASWLENFYLKKWIMSNTSL